ncbi:EutP/PduV family microcompartment system protein [Cohnella yongneupensis]|uniref:EutP/PduV family microcompartment system protein n=1 Tax=Cohnella yongneupensis TaxID=425006 RepID=A0ABW0QSS2_9BACL
MRRIMVIGAVGSGKSTLILALLNDKLPASKTQSLHFLDWLIDTPGEYTENPLFYRSLMATSHQASAVLLVQDATQGRCTFPPLFAGGFPVPCIGAITKLDHPGAEPDRAESLLRQALPQGAIVRVSAIAGIGIQGLREQLKKHAKAPPPAEN